MAEPLGQREPLLDAPESLVGEATGPLHPAEPAPAADAGIVAAVHRHVDRMGVGIVERERPLEVLLRAVELHQVVERHAVAVVRLDLRHPVVRLLAEREQLLPDVARLPLLRAHLVERHQAAEQRKEMRTARRLADEGVRPIEHAFDLRRRVASRGHERRGELHLERQVELVALGRFRQALELAECLREVLDRLVIGVTRHRVVAGPGVVRHGLPRVARGLEVRGEIAGDLRRP